MHKKILSNSDIQGEKILKLAEMCRKLETEEEKVINNTVFTSSSSLSLSRFCHFIPHLYPQMRSSK